MYLLGRRRCDKKVFLWSIFFIQLILIAAVTITFGSLNNDNTLDDEQNIKFLKNDSESLYTKSGITIQNTIKLFSIQKNEDFFKEFINSSLTGNTVCFRDGTDFTNVKNLTECKCKPDYHGKDCGQPEVLWRAFMTSKIPLNLSLPKRQGHKIIYFFQATYISMETLEIQMMELNDVVDLFVLCEENLIDAIMIKDKSFKLNAKTGFLQQIKEKIIIFNVEKCAPKSIYKKFRHSVGIEKGVTVDDVILYSKSDEILNRKAVKYFKWYDNWPQPAHFRLKYTVYGYFWQYPQSTIISSGACKISVLDEIFKSNPERMIKAKKPGMIVGDLNYIGGWFCQYCYHPLDIVKKLVDEEKDIFNKDKKVIDSTYIEHLISVGLYVDGKMGLTRLHRFSGKNYAPDSVSNLTWRYQHILTNVYATYDDYENE